jgi:extradiol dioxygenase family protein
MHMQNLRSLDSCTNVDQFWALADKLQEQTVEHAKDMFYFVETASPKQLFSLLVQYRFFTVYYISDIALLVARLHPGKMRSFLAEILFDELGNGDSTQAHPQLYDNFLDSLAIDHGPFEEMALADNVGLLERARSSLVEPSIGAAYGIGLRGMGGECVCQIYLARLYEHLILNPYIRARADKIDWKFWELHVGEHDIAHRETLRKLITDEVEVMNSGAVTALEAGYRDSMNGWSAFWKNIHEEATRPDGLPLAGRAEIGEVSLQAPATHSSDDERIAQFHLAIGVHDLMEARRFYCDVLGAKQGRSTKNLIDLDFYGHHLVIHQQPRERADAKETFGSAFYGEVVEVPHFGMNLDWQAWGELAERIKAKSYGFIDEPHIRMEGMPGEHATMFLADPSGNSLEFKAFRNHDEVFAVIFSPKTKDLRALEALVTNAVGTEEAIS